MENAGHPLPLANDNLSEETAPIDPRVERLVNELIGRVADKWTLLVLELLEDCLLYTSPSPRD